MDYVSEGNMFEKVHLTKNGIKEANAKRYFRQMTTAISFMHSNAIAHRDLKLENILLKKSSEPC